MRLRRSYLRHLRDEGRCGAVTRTATKLLEIEPGEIERARPVLPVHLEHEHRVLVPELGGDQERDARAQERDRKSTRLNSSHGYISYAVFCLKKKKKKKKNDKRRKS